MFQAANSEILSRQESKSLAAFFVRLKVFAVARADKQRHFTNKRPDTTRAELESRNFACIRKPAPQTVAQKPRS